MTTPEPVSPEVRRSPDGRLIAYCRSARHGLWRKSDGYDCDPEDVADWTPLVPAVSPVPDTEALRQQAAAILYRHRPLPRDVDALDDEAADFYAELVTRVVYAPALAGLRADLDQARADRTALGQAQRRTRGALLPILSEHSLTRDAVASPEVKTGYVAERAAELLRWYEVEVERLTAELAEVRAALVAADPKADLPGYAHVPSVDIVREITAARDAYFRNLEQARAGARPIPDDAAERLARWLFRMTGRRQGEPLYGDGAASPERQEKRWNTWLEDEDRDRLREMARHVLADLGATPTTDTAPANPPQVVSSVTCRADQHVMPSLPADVLRSGDRPCPCGGIVWRVTSPSTPARLCSDSAGPSDPEEK